MRPAWSPDGRRIAFTSARDGNHEVYVVNSDGTGLERLTTNADRDDFATWHPDGKRLLTVAERGGACDLWLTEVPT
jgi:TolB protein